jgi:tetratricopeptide (TPR) repeat protein
MPSRLVLPVLLMFAILPLFARADNVFVKGREKGVFGDVKSEDASGVTVLVKKTTEKFPAADVLDIHYDDLKPSELRLAGGAYKIAKDADKDSDNADPAKRKTALSSAIAKYNETLKKIDPKSPHPNATRTIRYRIAALMLKQAQDNKTSTANAIAELQKFRAEFPTGWQVVHVMPLIAQAQMDAGDFKGAAGTFEDMAQMDALPADVKSNAELMIVQVAVRANDIPLAQKKLAALEAKAKGNPKFASRVMMTKAEVLVGLKQNDEAIKLLNQVIKENNDKETKGLAHNTLGECLFKATKYNEALWEFIWVDTVFNQDKNQHAKALYYLWKTFEQLNNAERAQECREILLSAPFNGTDWQLRAQKETSK